MNALPKTASLILLCWAMNVTYAQQPAPPPAQLFDIVNDPFERIDLAAKESQRVSRMTNALASWFEDVEQDRRAIHD